MIDQERVREALTGPVASLRTPFLKDGRIDFDGLRNAIDFDIQAGSRTVLVTAGDSHFTVLSDKEIAQIARVAVEHTAGRAMVVVADFYYSTRQAIQFADYCRQIGADVLMLMPPDWAASTTPELLAEHYATVAELIPVMIVTNVFITRGELFGIKVLEMTLGRAANVVAIKDDMCGKFARKMALLVHDRWAVISGGMKENHMNTHPYGCDGYLSTFITFKPEITHRYWSAIEASDLAAAVAVIREFDLPFFDLLFTMPGGFDAGLHGTLELFGICQRWRPKPYYSLSDADMEKLAGGLREIDVL